MVFKNNAGRIVFFIFIAALVTRILYIFQIFSAMVDAFSSGQKTAYQAVQDAANQYDVILRQAVQ